METKDVIEHLMKSVRWEMSWVDTKKRAAEKERTPETQEYIDRILAKPDFEPQFEENAALAVLLLADVVFINNFWWKKEGGWPQDACDKISLNVNTNDVLAWGCADAIEMDYDDLEEVYTYWEKDPYWGTAVWYCKKLNMMPQKPVADSIRKMGIWDIDSMGLEKNPTDKDFEG